VRLSIAVPSGENELRRTESRKMQVVWRSIVDEEWSHSGSS